ncbi:hypothetical protein F9H63_15150 [Vibrio parahaemolyticus]|nr:hypothetical protein [Vibrio parahaemolyticus]
MGFTRENAAHFGALGGKKSKRLSAQEKQRQLRMADLARLRQILDGEHGKELQLAYLNTIKDAWGLA